MIRNIALAVAAVALCGCQPSGSSVSGAQSYVEAPTAAMASTTGLDAAMMAQTVAAAEELPRLRGMLVLRDGETLGAHRFNAFVTCAQ